MKEVRRRDEPFGWEQGDPLVIGITPLHLEYVQKAFNLRAHYVLPLDNLGGRRYNKIIVFRDYMLRGSSEELKFIRWMEEEVKTKLAPSGELFFV